MNAFISKRIINITSSVILSCALCACSPVKVFGTATPNTASLSIPSASSNGISFGQVTQGNRSQSTPVSIKNTGNTAAQGCTVSLTDDTNFTVSNTETCVTIDAEKSCTVNIVANPTVSGTISTSLTIACNSGTSAPLVSNSISVVALTPANNSISATGFTFSPTTVGNTSSSTTFTISNSGQSPATGCAAPALGGANAGDFSISSTTCSTTLAAASSCAINVTASPSGSGVRTSTLSYVCNAGGVAATTSDGIYVTGLSPVSLSFSTPTIPFGSLTQGTSSSATTVTLSNSGQTAASGCSVSIGDSTNFSLSSTASCATIAAGGSCNFNVTATPASAAAFATALSVSCSAGISANSTANGITATGLSPASIALNSSTFAFANTTVGSTSASHLFTVTNSGGSAATGCTAPALSGTNLSEFTIASTTCGSSLAAGGTCTIGITASPTTSSSRTASLAYACSTGGTAATSANGITVTGLAITLIGTSLSFTSACPAQDSSVPFLLPTTCIETLNNLPMNPITPFDNNSGLSYTFALSGTLPAGLTFSPSTGTISGTPTAGVSQTISICEVLASVTTSNCQSLILSIVTEMPINGPLTVNPALCSSVLGTGTNSDPIQLSTISDFDTCVRNYPSRAFKLTANVDFTSNQIATLPNFTGIFDGNSHQLSNWTSTGGGALFNNLNEGSIVKSLTLANFTVTAGTGILANALQGGIVHDISLLNSSIVDSSGTMGALFGFEFAPTSSPSYHGYVDHVTLNSVTVTSSTMGGWAWSGGVVAVITHTPFRISNVSVTGLTGYGGNSFGGLLSANETGGWGGDPNISNVWIDHVSLDSTSGITGGAFAAGIVSVLGLGDVVSNSYSLATVNCNDTGGAGIIGTPQSSGNGDATYIVNSYFAGALTGDGAIAGSSYYGGSVALVNTASLSTLSQPITGNATTVSNSNSALSDAQFKTTTSPVFSTWQSPPWTFANGSYPGL